jgi:hypothetical protein
MGKYEYDNRDTIQSEKIVKNIFLSIVMIIVHLIVSCSKAPYTVTECNFPIFIDNENYTFVQTNRTQRLGIWGDPSFIDETSSIIIVNSITNDTITVCDNQKYSGLKYLYFNNIDTTLTIAADDSIVVYSLYGKVKAKYKSFYNYSRTFKGWYEGNSLFVSTQAGSQPGVYLCKPTKYEDIFISSAKNANTYGGKIVVWNGNSSKIYDGNSLSELPIIAKYITFVNDTILAYSGNHFAPVYLFNRVTKNKMSIGEFELGYEPSFSINPDKKRIAYKKYTDNENSIIFVSGIQVGFENLSK